MAENRSFQDKQYAFAAHIRDPENTVAPPGIEDRRMDIYRGLFFNNLYNLLGTFFPVLRKLSSADKWRQLIREFMKVHRSQTPYFLELPEEFLGFLQNEYQAQDDDVAFLTELAHYEYVELALRVSPIENATDGIDADGDLLTGIPQKSELAWTFAYHYPVHRISSDYQPDAPLEQPVYLAVYRGNDDKVRFLELNAITAALLDAIENNETGICGEDLLRQLAATTGYPDVEALVAHGRDALTEMRQLDILIGTRRAHGEK